jgi:hypothetical protein
MITKCYSIQCDYCKLRRVFGGKSQRQIEEYLKEKGDWIFKSDGTTYCSISCYESGYFG